MTRPIHPAWMTALATGFGYLVVLALLCGALFVIPYLLVS